MKITQVLADECNKRGACYKVKPGTELDEVAQADLAWAASQLPAKIVKRYTEYLASRGVEATIVGRQRKIVAFCSSGTKKVEAYYQRGELHRIGAPAYVETFPLSGTKVEAYYQRGKRVET